MTALSQPRRLSDDNRADLLVALVVLVALAIGWAYKTSAQNKTVVVSDPNSGFSVQLPARWVARDLTAADAFLNAEDPRADSVYKTEMLGYSYLLDPGNPTLPDDIVGRLVERHGEELLGFHLLDIRSELLPGASAQLRVIEYAYVVQPIDQPFRAAVPVVVHAFDYIVYDGNEYWLLTFSADEQIMAKESDTLAKIIRSITLP